MQVRLSLAATVVALVALPSSAVALEAGAASADITPPVGTPMFAYTARSAVATPDKLPQLAEQLVADPSTGNYAKTFVASRGIHTRVRARALVLRGTRGTFALVQADLGGIPQLLTDTVLRRIAEPTGITADRLILSATHTHSSTGPIWPLDSTGYALLGGDLFDPRIFQLTADGVARAILDAYSHLAPARAGIGTTELHGASRNRNIEPFKQNPEHDEPVDPTLTVLRVERPDGTPVAAWSNFAIHPTSFGDENLLFSGDNAASAERVVETTLTKRSPHPVTEPVVDVWANSAEGDVSPDGGPEKEGDVPLQYVPNSFASANAAGTKVGRGILRAWEDAGSRLSDTLDLDSRYTIMGFDGSVHDGSAVGPIPALGAGGVVAPDGQCSPVPDIAGPGQGNKLPLLAAVGIAPLTAPVATWRVGDTVLVALPTEMTTQMGRRVRAAALAATAGTAKRIVIVGLANGYVSYTATPEEYDTCHYEGSFTLYGRQQGARYRDMTVDLVKALASGSAAPAPAQRIPDLAPPGGGGTMPRRTSSPGKALKQPKQFIDRMGVAEFRWQGGDPQVDAQRGRTFVSIQRQGADGWQTISTDDGLQDTVERSSGDIWTAHHQFRECDTLGTYRFRVTGYAHDGSTARPYTATSELFVVRPLTLITAAPRRTGRAVQLVATYPDPGKDILLALPRRVRTGSAIFSYRVKGRKRSRHLKARTDKSGLRYATRVPKGVKPKLIGVHDSCGNGQGARR